MQLRTNEIHVWTADLATKPEVQSLALLDDDERERAERFHLPLHKQRFIVSHTILRQILSKYVNISPQEIAFAYTQYKKPYLANPSQSRIQFNLAHSHEMAIYAITLDYAVGIDIEKTQENYHQGIAKRFFSEQENQELKTLTAEYRKIGFYRVWSRKEAMIKAIGKGLSMPLSSFSVATNDVHEKITINDEWWSLLPLFIHPDYQAALASNQNIKTICYWHFFAHNKVQ